MIHCFPTGPAPPCAGGNGFANYFAELNPAHVLPPSSPHRREGGCLVLEPVAIAMLPQPGIVLAVVGRGAAKAFVEGGAVIVMVQMAQFV